MSNELNVKSIEVKSQHPDTQGNYCWVEYDCVDICCLNLWRGAKYRFRYEDNSASEERYF